MPFLKLEAVGCPRKKKWKYTVHANQREPLYQPCFLMEISYVSNYKLSITLRRFQRVMVCELVKPFAKIHFFL